MIAERAPATDVAGRRSSPPASLASATLLTEVPAPDKRAIVEAACAALRAEADAMRRSADATRRAATHEEARPENDKDTRALEQSYLARGQAERVVQLEEAEKRLRFMPLPSAAGAVALAAVVAVEVDGEPRVLFVAEVGGGLRVEVDGAAVQLVTPASPLGRALLGKREGGDFELRVQGRVREYVVCEVT